MSKFTKRGVVLPSLKEPAASRPITDITVPAQLLVPLLAGDGSICLPAVGVMESIKRGDVLGRPSGQGGCPVFAPASGVLADVRNMMHPLLGNVTCAVLDTREQKIGCIRGKPVDGLSSDAILDLARSTGIVDELDGELLAKKLTAWRGTSVWLVADGSEQEPYASSAWAVLNESVVAVRDGLAMAARAIDATGFHIAVRLPKKREEELKAQLEPDQLFAVHGKYPASTASPETAPVRRVGVQACLALYRAAACTEPPCDCVVTIAGDAVANPQNVRVPFGTLVTDVLHFCGLSAEPQHVILGDAMTGITMDNTAIPLVAGITCLLAVKARPQPPVHTCIGCGRCVRACHADLLPYEIMRRLANMQYERLASLLAEECDGCGACSHVCPAGLDVTAKVLEARDAHGNIFLNWGDSDDL